MHTSIKALFIVWVWAGISPVFSLASYTIPSPAGRLRASSVPSAPVIRTVPHTRKGFRWKPAIIQSLEFLAIEHGIRLHEQKTRAGLKGPFFPDWGASVRGVSGWGDGDNWLTNYVAHPMEGAVAGYIQIQNDPRGQGQEFGRSKQYWYSRLKAFAWSIGYSTQFELGPISEATIGNVGMLKGTSGFVDLVMTPLAGLGLIIAEDALDRFVLRKLEARTRSRWKLSVYRIVLNPDRSFAGVLRGRFPWQQRPAIARQALVNKPRPFSYDLKSPPTTVKGWNQLAWPRQFPPRSPKGNQG
jgi:hypothetical protein